jgi:hypothetical protein
VNNHLQKAGTHFQSYIRRSLNNIASERQAAAEASPPTSNTVANAPSPQPESKKIEMTSEAYKQKLERLQQMFGYKEDVCIRVYDVMCV